MAAGGLVAAAVLLIAIGGGAHAATAERGRRFARELSGGPRDRQGELSHPLNAAPPFRSFTRAIRRLLKAM